MDRQDLREATYNWLKENYDGTGIPTATYPQWSAALINGYLEDGYNDFLCRTMYNVSHSQYATVTTLWETIPLSTTYNKIIRVESAGVEVPIVTPDQMSGKLGTDAWRGVTTSAFSSESVKYAVFETYASTTALRLYPAPKNATTIDLYTINNYTLSTDTATPAIPEVTQQALVYYAVSQALKRFGEQVSIQMSQFYYAQYLDYVRRYSLYNYVNANVMNSADTMQSLQPYQTQIKGG